MKICVISTSIWSIPLRNYGGLEQIAYWQAQELAKLGHSVLLVAPVGSIPPANVELHGTTLGEPERNSWLGYKDRLKNYDIIIDNSWMKYSYMSVKDGGIRGFIFGVCHAPIETMYRMKPPVDKPCLIGLSEDHTNRIRKHLGTNAECAYNGIDMDFYKQDASVERDGRYLFMGRMSSIKGPHVAVEICKETGSKLDVVGDDTITNEPDYKKKVYDACDGDVIKYWGGIDRESTVHMYSTRKALLNTIQWDAEPFGLVMVEAAACGQPCFVFDKGSPREIVRNGVSGFVVKTKDEMIDLVKSNAAKDIKSSDCRLEASRFSKEEMGLRYNQLAMKAMDDGGW